MVHLKTRSEGVDDFAIVRLMEGHEAFLGDVGMIIEIDLQEKLQGEILSVILIEKSLILAMF